MPEARYTLTASPAPLEVAQELADAIDSHIAFDALAIAINEADEARNLWSVVAYFSNEREAELARTAVSFDAKIARLPEVDWVRRSLEGLAPVTAGRFFLHGAHDRERRRSGGQSFEIDAGTAFGTGHHGTTAGCLLALDGMLKRTKPFRVFDLGCGTGVLAIAVARATHRPVLATDIDPEAVLVTRENARINGVAPLLRAHTTAGLHHPAIRLAAPFDLIFANILARPLATLAPGICALLAPGGSLVLSGITRDQLRWIRAGYLARGLCHANAIFMGNWVALVLHKPAANKKRP